MNQHLSTSQEHSGISSRFIGLIADNFIFGLIVAIFVIPGALVLGGSASKECEPAAIEAGDCVVEGWSGVGVLAGVVLILAGLLLALVIYVNQLASSGQTFGRRIAGVKVVSTETGHPPTFGTALVRTIFARLISGPVFLIGYLWMLKDDRNQTWHDKVAKTVVIPAR